MNTNQKIQNFLVKHKSQKKWRLFTVILSLIIVVTVVSSLIMPAISMTREYLQNSNGVSDEIMLLSAVPDDIKNSAINVTTADVKFNKYFNDSNGNSLLDGEYKTDSDEFGIAFGFDYEFNNLKGKFQKGDNVHLYIDAYLPNVVIEAIPDGQNKVYDGDREAGYFYINEGYISIKLNDDYIDYIESGTGHVSGAVELSGLLKRDNSESGKQTLSFGGQEITVQFPERKATLDKWNTVNSDGTISWSVRVNNPNGLDLSEYTIEDSMLTNAKEVTFNPNVGTHSGDKISFNQGTKDTSITITYKTDITYEQLKDKDNPNSTIRKNTATLKKGDETKDTKDSTANFDKKPITVDKKGTEDYKNGGTYNNKINWEIKVKSEYGTSLNGYIIEDANIPNNGIEITPSGVQLVKDGDVWKVQDESGLTKTQELIIKYQGDVNPESDGKTKNKVTVKYPDKTPVPEGEKTGEVEYKKKSDLIKFDKKGNYNQDTHEITWTITVSPKDNFSLNGYVLKDSQFLSSIDDFTITTNWNNDVKSKVELSNGQLKFKDDCNITSDVVITYKTKVSTDSIPSTGTTAIANDIGDDNNETTTKVTVTIPAKRNELNKVVNDNSSETINNKKEITKSIKWKASITFDDKFANKTYTDKLSNSNGATHTITDEQINAIEVWAGATSGGKVKLNSGYIVNKTSDGFTITFDESLDTAGYNYVDIIYETTATIPETSDFGDYKFGNTGSGFGDGSKGTAEYGITKGNPEKGETLDLNVNKKWDDNNNSANERPEKVYVKVLYNTKTGNQWGNYDNTDWQQYKEIIELTSSDSWAKTLSALPKSETKADETTGQALPTVYYYYKIVECDASGNEISYIKKDNGIYGVTNSSETNQNDSNQSLDITNKYYKNISITASKSWSDDKGNESNRKPITVELWRSTEQNNWSNKVVVDTQTLNDSNNWTYSGWSTLPSKDIVDGKLVTYYYKLVETKFGDTSISENNKIVDVSNGYYECGINSNVINIDSSNKDLSITNRFVKNVSIKPSKSWRGIENGNDITEIVVKLQRRSNVGGSSFEDVPDISKITLTAANSWSTNEVWSNLPRKDENGNDYYYKVVEESIKTSDGKTIEIPSGSNKVITANGYYDITDSGDSNNSAYFENDVKEISVTNTFHKTENLKIDVKKVWNDENINETDYSSNRPSSIIVELQRKVKNSSEAWETLDKQTLSVSGKEQTYSWDGTANGTQLVSQIVNEDGSVTEYEYRAIEVGYIHNGTTYKLPENETKFATNEDEGNYEGSYKVNNGSNNILHSSGEVEITNTFVPVGTIEITPQKKWVGDSGDLSSNRPTSIKFKLQQKLEGATEWTDVTNDALGNAITNPIELTGEKDTDTWTKEVISNLPQKVLTTEDIANDDGTTTRKLKEKKYYYRFIEIVDENELENDSIFKVDGGKYIATLQSDLNHTGTFVITNTFQQSTGITKYLVGNDGKAITAIDKDDLLAEKSPYKKTIDGEDYYVFNWMLEYDVKAGADAAAMNAIQKPVIDILPEGFTLCEAGKSANQVPGLDQLNGFLGEAALNKVQEVLNEKYEGYHNNPIFIWQNSFAMWMEKKSLEKDLWDSWTNSTLYYYEEDYKGDTLSYGQQWTKDWSYVRKDEDGNVLESNVNESLKGKNIVIFNKPNNTTPYSPFIGYSTKIKCEDLEALIEKDSYVITNNARMYEPDTTSKEVTEMDKTGSASLTIVNKAPSNLISKTYHNPSVLGEDGKPKDKDSAVAPGYMNFTLDINPEGKNLSNGDTIDIEDIFQTNSYTMDLANYNKGTKKTLQTVTGTNLVDVLMDKINIYEVDANGNKIPLSRNDYTLKFESKETGVTSGEDKGAALIKLTIPDEKHIVIDYNYKLITNNNTPPVINECKVMIRGKNVKVEKGFDIPGNDSITFQNKAKLSTESVSGEDEVKSTEYKVAKSYATIQTNRLPKIKKVNTGNYNLNNLDAKFLIAKYNDSQQKWEYATEINKKGTDNNEITKWGDGVDGSIVDKAAISIDVDTSYEYSISLEKSSLYKLVEIKVPEGYEGSNLGLSDEDFKNLIVNYLNNDTNATPNIADYKVFLDNYVPVHYFVYNSVLSSYPAGVDPDKVIQVNNGGDIEIPNNELIDIGVSKEWNDGAKSDAEITVELYWSDKKVSTGMPENAKLATAEDLGLMDENFSATKTINMATLPNNKVWTDIPNGKDDKPIYYYIKETSYTVNGTTYTLVNDAESLNNGKYVDVEGNVGTYYPTYVGNAANTNSTINVKNSTDLKLIKLWKDSSNNPLAENKITAESVIVDIYGIKNDVTSTEEKLFEDVEITPDAETGKWELNITNLLENAETPIDLSQYKSFRADESKSSFDVNNYVVSCVFNLNNSTGEITITNKKIGATSASVTANKEWSDGSDVHAKESIKVSLYQSKSQITDLSGLTADKLTNAGAVKMTDTENQKYTVELNTENEWTYTWTGLPLEDEENGGTYYYYVLEDTTGIANADKYEATYVLDSKSSNTKTVFNIKNTRNSIVAQKEWYNEGGLRIEYATNENGEKVAIDPSTGATIDLPEIQLKLYKKTATVPENGLKIVAIGDSITYANTYGVPQGQEYPTQMQGMLKEALGNNNVNVTRAAMDGRHISEMDISTVANNDIVCLLAGTNDIHHGAGSGLSCNKSENLSNLENLKSLTKSEIKTRMQNLISSIKGQKSNVKIFIGTIPYFVWLKEDDTQMGASNWWWCSNNYQDKKEYQNVCKQLVDVANEGIAEIANADDNIYLVDVCGSLLNDETQLADSSLYHDGCHLNTNGCTKVATAYSNAIAETYATKEYVQENNTDKIIILNKDNNWTASIDVPDSGEYCVEEVNVPDGWTVSYENNKQKAGSKTPITVKNQKQATPKTSIQVEKTWVGDSAEDPARDGIILNLMYSTDQINWEYYPIDMPEPSKNNDKWTYTFRTLPTKDLNGNTYYYKVEEEPLPGYSTTYGENESSGLIAVDDNASSGILHVTNTRMISLKVQKQWSDIEENNHVKDKVTIQIYRSTNPSDIPGSDIINPMLQIPSAVSLGTGKNITITPNKEITEVKSSDESIAKVELVEGNIVITADNSNTGTVVITVSDGLEEKEINVKVSALEMFLNNSNENYTIEAGKTGTLSAKVSGVETSATFASSNTNVITIDGNTITAVNVGTSIITCEVNGITTTQEITVTLPSTFTLDGEREVAEKEQIQLTPNPAFGTFTWSSSNDSIATVDSTGKVTGVLAGNVTITATRNDGIQSDYIINVVKGQIGVVEGTNLFRYDIPADKQKNITSIIVTLEGGDNPDGDGLNVYLNSEGANNSWVSFNNNNGKITSINGYNGWDNYFRTYKYSNLTFTLTDRDSNKSDISYITFKCNKNNTKITIKSIEIVNASSVSYSLRSATEDTMVLSAIDSTALTGELVETVELKDLNNWQAVVDNLPVYNGSDVYYYWAVETDGAGGYTAVYSFSNSDDNTSNCLNASKIGDGLITVKNIKTDTEGVVMPSTGGAGTTWYYITGAILVLSSGTIGTLRLRRRKKKAA